MQYSEFGKTGIQISRLGLGTNRFSPADLKDSAGISRAAELVRAALENGVNYIDSAYPYSKGKAELILREALSGWKRPYYLTVKSAINLDKDSDSVLRRIEASLNNMGIDQAAFFLAWTITSYEDYMKIMKKDGYFEGAMKAKDRGLIEHICFATHCPPDETVKIIQDGAFEGVTINSSVLNYEMNIPVFEAAAKAGIGVVTMSSLATGIIPKNPRFFDCIKMEQDASVAQAALRFVCAQPGVCTTLAGVSTLKQLQDNLCALKEDDLSEKRIRVVLHRLNEKSDYCTGCRACEKVSCPSQMPLMQYMQAYNARFFTEEMKESYARTDPQLIQDIEVLKKLKQDYAIMPETGEGPCKTCRKCKDICPKGINIKESIEDIYRRAENRGFSKIAWRERMAALLKPEYKKVAFYPAGGYTGYVWNIAEPLLAQFGAEVYMFDSNASMWGETNNGIEIRNPSEIAQIHPDCIIVSNYIYQEEIFNDLKKYEEQGIRILKLHRETDGPWVF